MVVKKIIIVLLIFLFKSIDILAKRYYYDLENSKMLILEVTKCLET